MDYQDGRTGTEVSKLDNLEDYAEMWPVVKGGKGGGEGPGKEGEKQFRVEARKDHLGHVLIVFSCRRFRASSLMLLSTGSLPRDCW